ncbi:LysR substrate-binding domain-containing protein [Serratia rubidaea]|uniref:LysR substrate-binding domain-containing protein n=1 Tax=Serratia rubidaea TaxID=61652 RepID=UPI001BAF4820|nr:hypothetical protein [Serratia rubidaea]MBS0974240.1 hypothetical protein [Serratia rubidaea]
MNTMRRWEMSGFGRQAPALRRGTLVRVLPQWCKPVAGFHLYYPRNGFMTPQMRAFVDFMRLDTAAGTRQE